MELLLEIANSQRFIRLLKNALFAGEGGGASKYRRDEIAIVKFFRYCE